MASIDSSDPEMEPFERNGSPEDQNTLIELPPSPSQFRGRLPKIDEESAQSYEISQGLLIHDYDTDPASESVDGEAKPLDDLSTRADGTEYPRGLKLFFIVLALTLAVFWTSTHSYMVATSFPKIINQFHTVADVGWYGSSKSSVCIRRMC
jgi:hypothetical protein